MDTKDLMTIRDAAALMQVEVPTVYQMIYEKRLPSVEVLGKKAVRRADVDAYLARVRPDGVKPRGRPRKGTGGEANAPV
jgi:excisionase family DNA binding protein